MLRPAEEYARLLQNVNNSSPSKTIDELLNDGDSNLLINIWPYIKNGNRWGKLLFLKYLRTSPENNILQQIRFYMNEHDLLMNFLAMEILTERQIPDKNDLLIELLHHPSSEVKLLAARYAGNAGIRESLSVLIRMMLSTYTPGMLRKEVRRAIRLIILPMKKSSPRIARLIEKAVLRDTDVDHKGGNWQPL